MGEPQDWPGLGRHADLMETCIPSKDLEQRMRSGAKETADGSFTASMPTNRSVPGVTPRLESILPRTPSRRMKSPSDGVAPGAMLIVMEPPHCPPASVFSTLTMPTAPLAGVGVK